MNGDIKAGRAWKPKAQPLHWDAAAEDYRRFRPGYPKTFFVLLRHLGVGLARQRILDLGTGTGALALPFAAQGARVTAVDLSEEQIRAARMQARARGLKIRFRVCPVETTDLPSHEFDVVSASMCWGYFHKDRIIPEVVRLLRPQGLLLISSLHWLEEGEIAMKTRALMAAYNPGVQRRQRNAEQEIVPEWSAAQFKLQTYHEFLAPIRFTRASWRGRIRASKWIGAALPGEDVKVFDREHELQLNRIAPSRFTIWHRIRIQIFSP